MQNLVFLGLYVAKDCCEIKERKMMKIGYARVLTEDQNLDLQLGSLNRAGCKRIFTDHRVSGVSVNRPDLAQAVAMAGPSDVLVVG
jgi:DNA invertase Pin-like site-specific DNA recombinase